MPLARIDLKEENDSDDRAVLNVKWDSKDD
jgi:hypothetical protein